MPEQVREAEQLAGEVVRLVRPVPTFGGTWQVGDQFLVERAARQGCWNLKFDRHRGLCNCPREAFEVVGFEDL